MTAIAGLVEKGKVWMGGDSAGVGGLSLSVRAESKVFLNGEFIIGYTTSFRMGQILEYNFSPPKPKEDEQGMAYMVKCFIPAVRAAFKEHGFKTVEDTQESGGCFLVGFRGDLYKVEGDYQVGRRVQEYHACGSGTDLLLGSLHSTKGTKLKPRERLLKALKAAEEFCAGVRKPFHIISK